MIGRLYRKLKVKINTFLGRIIVCCDQVLMQVHLSSGPIAPAAQWLARSLGNACWLLRSFPRQAAYRLVGKNWTIVYVGQECELAEIGRLFFPEDGPAPLKIGRVALWSLGKQTKVWLEEGVDLVISELSSTYRLSPPAPIVFHVPSWIEHVLDLPESLDALLRGKDVKSVRHSLNVAAKANFGWRYSQDKTDFDLFYHRMYVPYIVQRHGDRVFVAPYQDQWRRWFSNGGLIVVTQDGRPVGGLLCYVRGRRAFAIEAGVLDADPDLMRQQIDTFLYYSTIEWAHQQGARSLNLGGTRPCQSDGVFLYKSHWRPRVAERSRIYGVWTFAAGRLSASQRAHLNELGLVARHEDGFYGVSLDDGSAPAAELEKEDAAAKRHGLAGLLVLAVDRDASMDSGQGVGSGAVVAGQGPDTVVPPLPAEESAGIEASR